jgi:MFS family permease
MASAVTLGMIFTMFPKPNEQARAIGVYGFVASAGGSIGLLLGGVLTQSINWHWIFFVNVPVGIATAFLALRYIERDRGIGFAKGADVLGAVLITGALMLLVYTIVDPAAKDGWGAGRTLDFGAAAVALLVAFVAREATAAHPLIPLRIFRSRTAASANLIQLVSVPAMFGMFFLGALYLERVLGYTPLQIGFAFLPSTLVMGTLSLRFTERFVMRYGARRTLITGLTLIAAGLLLFTRSATDSNYFTTLLPVMLLFGAGAGSAFPALVKLTMADATPQDAGLASGLVNTTAQVGGALGLAVLATAASGRTHDLLAAGRPTAEALNGGFHLAYLIGVGLILGAIAIATLVLRPKPAQAHAEHRHPAGEPTFSEASG